MRRTETEIERDAIELRGRIEQLVAEFEAANGVAVTGVSVSRIPIRTMGHISSRAIMHCDVCYVTPTEKRGS